MEASEQLFVPHGFAHGHCTLEADTDLAHKVNGFYTPDCNVGLAWDNPELAFDWPSSRDEVILSDSDTRHSGQRIVPQLGQARGRS